MNELLFIKGCYAEETSDKNWGALLSERIAGVVREPIPAACYPYEVSPKGLLQPRWVSSNARADDLGEDGAVVHNFLATINADSFCRSIAKSLYCSGRPQATSAFTIPEAARRVLHGGLPKGTTDTVALMGSVGGNQGIIIGWTLEQGAGLSSRKQRALDGLSEHLAAGYQLREMRRTQAMEGNVAAVLSPDGRFLEGDEVSSQAAVKGSLIDALRGRERTRCARKKHSPEEALRLWRALVEGQYALVDSVERGGRRVVMAVRVNKSLTALTPRELRVTRLVASGLANRGIAEIMGIAVGTVAAHLHATRQKLDCANRAEVIALVRGGFG